MKKIVLLFILLFSILMVSCDRHKGDNPPHVNPPKEPEIFEVCFYNDGELLDIVEVEEGKEAIYTGITPTKEKDHDNKYEFNGWDQDITCVKDDMEVNAVFKAISRYYTVTFVDFDGTVLDTIDHVYEGQGALTEIIPKRTGYMFNDWMGNYKKVYGDVTITARYIPLEYTLSFSGLTEDLCEYPSSIIFTIEDEFDLPVPKSNYEFAGWNTDIYWTGEVMTKLEKGTYGDIELYAQVDFDSSKTELVFLNWDNSVFERVEYTGSAPSVDNPTRTGYTFVKWSDYDKVDHDILVIPEFSINTYSVNYNLTYQSAKVNGDLKETYQVIDEYKLPYLTYDNYAFVGWYDNSEFSGSSLTNLVAGDYNLYAKFIEIKNPSNKGEIVSSDEVIEKNLSTQFYIKVDGKYITPDKVTYESYSSSTIDQDGFFVADSLGYNAVTLTYQDYQLTKIVEVVEDIPYTYVGHTGCIEPGTVQNTYNAFVAGAKRGYSALECDLRLSKDGVLFIHHDNLFYTDPAKACAAFDLDTLTKYGLKSEDNMIQQNWSVLENLLVCDGATKSKLCLLEDYLKICKEYNIKAVIEIKWNTGMVPSDQSNIPLLVEKVQEMGMYESTIFMTSMQEVLFYIRNNYKDANLQYLTDVNNTNDTSITWCIKNKISLDCPWEKVTRSAVIKMHNAHLYVNIYTAETSVQASNGIKFGCDMITTDYLK